MMMPAWGAITPEMVLRAELQSAISLNTIGMNISRSVGPGAGWIDRCHRRAWNGFHPECYFIPCRHCSPEELAVHANGK